MATISTNTNWGAIGYSAGEDIDIDSGATLTIDAQVPADVTALATLPGNVRCLTSGKLRVVNTSTTTPICLTLQNNADDYRFEQNGIFEVRGAAIEIGTGTGLAGQTFDFSSSPLDVIPYPSYVEVETASGSGVYLPWWIICTAGATVTHSLSEFCGGTNPITGNPYPAGRVLAWNATTRILSCGDDTNGNVIPSGAKVRIPNIYFHSNVNNATPTAKTRFDLNPTGTADMEWCAFSNAIFSDNTTFGGFRAINVGFCGVLGIRFANGDVEIDGLANNPDTEQNTYATDYSFRLDAIFGSCKVRRVSTLAGGLPTTSSLIYLWKLYNLTSADGSPTIEECNFGRFDGRDSTADAPLNIQNLPSGVVLRNVYASGGRVTGTNLANITFENCGFADGIGTAQRTDFVANGWAFINCQNVVFVGYENSGVAAPRSAVINTDDQSRNVQVYNMDYDGGGNVFGMGAGTGSDLTFANCTVRNLRSNANVSDSPATNLAANANVLNCRATGASGYDAEAINNAVYDLVPIDDEMILTFSGGNRYAFTNAIDDGLTPTTGKVYVGPLGTYSGLVLGGQASYDQRGAVLMPGSGDSIEAESLFVMHGVTSFQNVAPLVTYDDTASGAVVLGSVPVDITLEFRVRNPSGSYGAYQTMNATNLSGALAALSGYDSDVGFYMQVRITTTAADSARIFRQIKMLTNVDNTYTAPDANITFTGVEATDKVCVYLNEGGGPSTDTMIYEFTGSGTKDFTVGANYNEEVYLVRVTSTDEIIVSTRSTPFNLTLGNNGSYPLFAGSEVQLAQATDVTAIKALVDAYLDAAISSRVAEVDQAARQVILVAEHDATQAAIGSLNDLSAAQVNAEVDTALADYDAPTKAELDTAQAAIVAEIDANEAKIDIIDSNVDAILVDTNELQTNQGNWLTATGFATPTNVSDAQTAIVTEINANETKIDTIDTVVDALAVSVAALETKAQADTRQTALIAEHDATQAQITALNDFDPTTEQVIVATNNDKTGYSISGTKTTLDALNDISSADVTAAVPSTAQIEAALLNEGDGQQLIDAIVTAIGNSNVDEIALVAAIRADLERAGGMLDVVPTLSEIEASTVLAKTSDIAGLNDITAAEVWAAATRTITGGQVDTIAGTIQTLDALDTAQDTQHAATQSAIGALNDISAAEVNAEVDTALADYDGPTKAELDAAQASIESDVATAQTSLDAIKTNTDLIPAAL